jgi:hypothetical protein
MRLPMEFHFAALRIIIKGIIMKGIIMKGIVMKMGNLENADCGKKVAYLIPRFLTAEASTSSR